jgi:polar amino acid transport system substrate-binding protein
VPTTTAPRRRLLIAALLLSLVLAPLALPGSLANADVRDQILARGFIRIGVSPFVPWTLEKPFGELAGFEIDVGRKLAADMGVEAQFVVHDWDDIIPALERGDIDVIAAGMAITPSRALRVNFSLPYSQSGVSLAANRTLTKDVNSLEDLNSKGVPIAVVEETLAHDIAVKLFERADLKSYKTASQAEAALITGTVQAYVASVPEVNFLALRFPADVDVPLSKPLSGSGAGFGVARGQQELLNFLNAWVLSRTADGWIDTIYEYWFETLEWSEENS